jgi:hypothetical protein
MGIMFERDTPTEAALSAAIHDALNTDASEYDDPTEEAAKRARQLRAGGIGKRLQEKRVLAVVALLVAMLVVGVVCDAKGWDNASTAMFGFGASILTATLALLAGESASS